MKYRLILLLLAGFLQGKGQTHIIDALKQNMYTSATGEQQLKVMLDLCDQSYSLHPDTLMLYAVAARKKAIEQKNRRAELTALYQESVALTNKGLLDSALHLADSCLSPLRDEINDPLLLCNVLNQRGRCFVRKNQYKEAIDMAYQIIGIAEKANEELPQVKAKTLIGWSYLEMGQHREALNWHLKALSSTSDSILLQKYAILFANIATNYNALNKLDSAFYYINKGIRYARKHENLFALSNSLAIASELHVKAGEARLSEPLLKEVVAIRKQIGDPFYTASDLAQLGYYYAHYGQPEKGVEACNEGIALAYRYKLTTKLFFLYGSLADNYKAMGNLNEYARVMSNIIHLKDSVYERNSANALADMNSKYELQKKENTIIQQRLWLIQKNAWIYAIASLLLFMSLLAYIYYRNNKKRQEQKITLALMEEKRVSEKAILVAQELERKRIAADLHDNLGAYAAAIASNVDMLGNEKNERALEELKNNAQSIVAQLNDTIWVLNREELSLTAISDRLKVYIQRLQQTYPAVQIDVKETIQSDTRLPPMQAFHLFKILQEGILNALKHSGGNRIKVSISSDSSWLVTIEDNGKGMRAAHTSELGGNGLYNMKNRSEAAGWQISWSDKVPAGTLITIKPTTN